MPKLKSPPTNCVKASASDILILHYPYHAAGDKPIGTLVQRSQLDCAH